MSLPGKNLEKGILSQTFMKSSLKPNFDMENSKIRLIIPIFFIFILIFVSINQKCLKLSQKKFSPIFMKITTYPNFDMENSKTENILPYFFFTISIFSSISKKCLIKWVKNCFLRFSRKLPHNLIFMWRIQKLILCSHAFSSSFSVLV